MSKGIKGFYAGYISFIMREIPFSGIQFPLYEMLKAFSAKNIAKSDPSQMPGYMNSINGSIAGSFAGFLVTPFDVAKTRLMTYDVQKELPSTPQILR